MNRLLVLFLPLLFNVVSSWAAQSVDELQKEIHATTDMSAQAKLYKVLGDRYVSQDRYDLAADAFATALTLARDNFPAAERVQMAVYLSWADRLRESERELRAVLARDPKNLAARTHLARVLSWSGELSEAVDEADKVLKESPENREALLIKADALLWKGRINEAMPIYQKLMGKGADFNAQAGLAHSWLALGNRTAAIDTARPLKPTTFAQQREYDKLVGTIEKETNPRLDTRYLHYRDSDKNQLNRYLISHAFWFGNWSLDTSFRHTDANDRTRSNRAEDLLFKMYSSLTDNVGAGIGLGFNQLGDGKTTTIPTGQFRIDARVLNGTAGIAVTREGLSDTAEQIVNRIRATNAGWNLSQMLTDRLGVNTGYTFKHFSNRNRAHDFQFNTEYTLLFDPKVIIAHRFRFLDFQRQSSAGQFDPDNYYSNRGVVSFYIQRPKYYAYAEAFLGHQAFRRNGFPTSDFIQGGAASLGFTPTRHWVFEIYGEGGNFAAGSGSGFTYFIVGPRVIYRF
jgi:tetratricopeptide (TPR) repeat protein